MATQASKDDNEPHHSMFFPLTPPPFSGTQEEFVSNRIADLMRHLGKVSPDDIPPRYYLVSKDGSPIVPPPVVPPPEVSDPKPAEQARSRASDIWGASSQGARNVGYDPPSPNLPHLSANLQSPRFVDALRAELPQLISNAPLHELQEGIKYVDAQSLIPIHFPDESRALYTLEIHIDDVFYLSIDTGGRTTWFFGKNFGNIPSRNQATCPWTETELMGLKFRRTVVPIDHKTHRVLPFDTRGTPNARHLPNGIIRTKFPCWSWKDGKPDTYLFELPCVLAFGANEDLALRNFDGNIGLGVPPLRRPVKDFSQSGRSSYQFFDALQLPHLQVYDSHQFLIKLNHPDKLAACQAKNALDFLFFGPEFPSPLVPEFTPRLLVTSVAGEPTETQPAYTHWMVALESISLVDSKGKHIKIPLVRPEQPKTQGKGDNPHGRIVTPSATSSTPATPPAATNYSTYEVARVALDSGSTLTFLPLHAVEAIRDLWLCNKKEVLSLKENVEGKVHLYCGPERNLDQCDIIFTFAALDGYIRTEFRCPAKPFLKSKTPLPSEGSRRSPQYFQCNVSAFKLSGVPEPAFHILGLNFYWSSIVKHCGPTEAHPRAYVQLAPQRAIRSDGTMGSAEDFEILPHLPPKYLKR
ncbi:uncharacterized protein TRAVEDRAFT_23834 [Trametes versicolor FP-101664 SS1]|uniref:uncharacterized protein n=1 Tax=Trametes versicolor (strain FP-101664) TaxID=717944 RepID=UPI0004623B2A|nr:uncharacterized protein TRAVEDRAFT_23834 [Trametes versicolor FP-101664 SS1]EIW53488.1 hypothetical protein TRAVEDRAFT_23834 [Trametes versicolor FP-101664 SS1]